MKGRASAIVSSYRFRIAAGYAVALALVAAAWLWTLYVPLSDLVLEQQQTHLRGVAQAGAIALPAAADPQVFAERLVAGTALRATVVAADGRVLADTEEAPAAMENHRDRPEVAAALAGRVGVDRRVSRTLGTEHIYVAVPATMNGERVVLRVSESAERVMAVAASWRRTGLALLAVSLIAAVAVSAWLAGRATRSLTRLAGAARDLASGDLASRIPDEPGELGVLSSALSDMAGQIRRRLDDLEAEQRTLRTALDGLEDAVLIVEGGTVQFANRAASALFRVPYGGWRGAALGAPAVPAAVVAVVTRGGATDGVTAEECPPDPTGRCLRVTVVPLAPAEGGGRVLVAISDVTERARLDAVRRDFVANASHELKTPVTGIQLLAESVTRAAADEDAEATATFARQIEGEAARLRRLVLDLLDLSRLETAPQPGTVTDVREAVEMAVLGHRPAAAAKGLKLASDASAAEGEDVFVKVDVTDLAIALDNLLANAVAYTDAGAVTVRLSTTPSEAVVSVEDTGAGIAAEHLPRIFERFYRVDRARSRDAGGTGLGLALVKHVTENAGGTIEVASEVGVGSTFTLRLPRAN